MRIFFTKDIPAWTYVGQGYMSQVPPRYYCIGISTWVQYPCGTSNITITNLSCDTSSRLRLVIPRSTNCHNFLWIWKLLNLRIVQLPSTILSLNWGPNVAIFNVLPYWLQYGNTVISFVTILHYNIKLGYHMYYNRVTVSISCHIENFHKESIW